MAIEIFVDVFSADIANLATLQEEYNEIEVEYASGISGLEIAGTLIIPSVALLLQIISFIRELNKKKEKEIQIKKMEIIINSKIFVIRSDQTIAKIENTIEKIIETNG